MRRVRKLTTTLAILIGALTFAAPALATEGIGVTGRFGGPGSGAGELSLTPPHSVTEAFDSGSGVAVNSAGDVYVADTGNNRVEQFAFNATTKAYEYMDQFSGSGTFANEKGKVAPAALSAPEGIAVDNDPSSESYGDVYVVIGEGEIVDKFSATGEFLFQLPTTVGRIGGIATDSLGDVWVGGYSLTSGPVQEFNSAAKNTSLVSLETAAKFDAGIAVDSEDNLYIMRGTILYKFSDTGTYLGTVCNECRGGVAIDPATNDLLADTGSAVAQYGPFGEPFEAPVLTSEPEILKSGAGIAVNPTSHAMYVAEAADDEVVIMAQGPTPETPETLSATEIKGKSAVFQGKLEPASTKLEYYFEYNTGPSCAGGLKTPIQAGEGEVKEEVTGLEPRAEYTVCLVAKNEFGATAGNEGPFTTLAGAPAEVISESAATPPEEEARLVFLAVINPDHSTQETTYSFEYSTEGSTTNNELTGTIETAVGRPGSIGPEAYEEAEVSSKPVFAADNRETIYYRVVTSNGNGPPVTGKVQAYTKLPIVFSDASSGLTLTSATLEAKISSDFVHTEYHFEYATNEALLEEGKGAPVPGGEIPGGNSELEETQVSVVANGLTPNKLYYYRVIAENGFSQYADNINEGKPIRGKIEHFTTESLPFVNTGEAQGITRTSATLLGTVTPIDQATTYYFQYISEAGYRAALSGDAEQKADPFAASEATAPLGLSVNASPQAVGPVPASGLLPEETYHYRLVAKNEFGVRYGEGATFTTGAKMLPGVSTGGASGVSQNSATLSGTVTTNGLQTNYGFEIGTAPGVYSPATGLGAIGGAATEEVHVTLGELQPGTTYYYRVTATNADGTVQGEPESFTTPGFPTLIAPPASPPLIATPNIVFPKEEATTSGTGATTKSLTKAQKLKKALKTCKRDKKKAKRVACEKRARKRYPTAKKKAKRK